LGLNNLQACGDTKSRANHAKPSHFVGLDCGLKNLRRFAIPVSATGRQWRRGMAGKEKFKKSLHLI
jgi:hypothetical protein